MRTSTQEKSPPLTAPQLELLRRIAPFSKFTEIGAHHKTKAALVSRGYALENKDSTAIKPTAKGRKLVAKQLNEISQQAPHNS